MELERIRCAAEKRMRGTVASLEGQLSSWKLDTLDLELLKGLGISVSCDRKARLGEVASVANSGSKAAVVRVHDKANIRAVLEGITTLRCPIEMCGSGSFQLRAPDPTTERKNEVLQTIKREGEKAKVKIRDTRRNANEAIKKAGKASKLPADVERKAVAKVQELTDYYTGLVANVLHNKQAELA